MAAPFLLLILALSCVVNSFDLFEESRAIPADGFHDLLDLTPFWLSEHQAEDLRRTLGTKRDNLPEAWNTLVAQTTGAKTYTIAGRCSVEAAVTGEKVTLTNKGSGGCVKASLKMIFEKLFPAINVMSSTQKFIYPDKFFFEKLEISKASKEVKIDGKAKDPWRVLSGDNFVLTDVSLSLGFTAGVPVQGIKEWAIKATGTLAVSSHSLKMVIDKPKGKEAMPFKWDIETLLMVDIMGIFGVTISQLNFMGIGLSTDNLEGVTFANPECTGEIGLVDDIETSGSETFQLVCKASVSNSKAMKSGDVYLVLTRAKGQVVRPAILIDVKDIFNIQEALEHFISEGAFISDFSMLGRIERDCIIMIAKDDIIMVNNAALMKLVGPFITPYDTKQIPKGVHVRVKIPLKENMKKGCKMDLPESEIPDILPITIEIKPGGLNFKFPDKFKSNMPKFLKCLDPQIQAELPSQLFPRPDGLINIKEITIGQGRYFKMTIVLQGPFKFLGGKIQVADLEVSVEREKGNNDLKFTGVTTITVGKLAVGLTLEKEGNTYTFSAYVESFKLDQLEQMIGPNDILDFVKFLGKLKDFGIKDFKLVKEFGAGSEHKSLRIAGQPILWGYENVFCEGLIWKPRQDGSTQQPKTAIAVGIVIESVRLDKILEKILGDNLFSAAWFSEMTCIFIISNADGKVEASDDPKGKANDIDKAKEGKADSPDKDKPSPPGRSTVGGNYNGHPHVLERYARGLRYRTHLSHLRKRGQSLHTPSYANYMQRFNSAQRSTRPHLMQHYQNTSLHRRVDTGKAGGKAGDKSAEKPKGDGEDDKADDKKEDDEEEEAEIKFKVPYLSSRDIKPGLTFIGIFNIPQSHKCYGDSLCLWLAEKVGKDATLEISGRIGKGEFEFGAKFSGTIPINSDGSLVIQSIELKLVLSGKKSSIKLECTLYWNIPESLGSSQVQFIGGIEVSLTGKLSLTFAMANMWKNPFRVEYLAFGNLNLGIGIAVGLPIPSFEFGGEVWVGVIDSKGSNDHAIKIACYFGIDVNRPDDNYIYASVNQFTIGAIFRAFKLAEPKDIPKFVRESGFPEGITVAYSTKGKEIDALDIKIEAGLYLKGTLNFLGFKVAAEVIVQLPRLLIDVELSPIDWAGGLIQLRRSADDRDNGPKAFIYLTASSVTVQINGYISLLGMSREVKIDVSDTAFKFEMKTDLWGMIRSELYVEAAYGSLASLAFEFRASVIIDLHLDKIFQAGKKYLKKGADIAIKKLEEAKKKVEEAERSLRNAKGKMEGWKSNINAFQNRLKRRAAQIEEAKKKFRVDCERECGTVCIPFLDWKSRCFKILWWWVGCPYWNSCRWRVKNFICIAGCEIKKLAKKFVAWAEQIGIKILIGLAEIGKGLIDVGKGFVTMAEGLVSFGKDVLSFVQKVIEVGSKIMSDVMDWLAENLFKIDLLELRAKLTPDFNACVGMTVKCVIVGVKIDYSGDICVNLNFWDNLAADTVEKKYPGVKKMNNEVPTIDGKLSEFDNDKKDLDKKGKNIEKDVKRETGKVKRDTVPTAEEMYYKRLAEDPLPPVITRSEATVNFFKNDAPWVLVQDFDTRNLDHAPRIDENIPADKRTLDEDWEKHAATPCVQINKVISKYSMIADGLHSLYHSMRDVRENYQATKRTMQQGVDNLESDVRDTEMKHNMTHEERTDLYHWYNEAKDGLDKWDSKTKRILADEHELVLPRFRSQIEHILKREKNTNFKGYMEELHHVGEAAYKRSNIPNKNMIEAAQELKGIKKDLINLVQSDESNQLRFGAKVRSIRTNIKGLRRSMERCN